jgi:hypothetical protein
VLYSTVLQHCPAELEGSTSSVDSSSVALKLAVDKLHATLGPIDPTTAASGRKAPLNSGHNRLQLHDRCGRRMQSMSSRHSRCKAVKMWVVRCRMQGQHMSLNRGQPLNLRGFTALHASEL